MGIESEARAQSSGSASGARTESVTIGATAAAAAASQDAVKRRLEIRKLQRETGWEGRAAAFATPASVLIALVAAGFGAYSYLKDAATARRLRTEERTREARSDILAYPDHGASRNAVLVAALSSLHTLAQEAARPIVELDGTSGLLSELAIGGVDLHDPDQARFDLVCAEYWPPWTHYWREHHASNRDVLRSYVEALGQLVRGHQAAVKGMTVTSDDIAVPEGLSDVWPHLSRLLHGYRERATLLDGAARRSAGDELGIILGNSAFASSWIGL